MAVRFLDEIVVAFMAYNMQLIAVRCTRRGRNVITRKT